MIWCALALAVELDETRARATEQAIDVALAEQELRAASGRTWSAASGALPQVDLFASANTGAGLTSFGFERPVATQLGAGVTGRWTLVNPGGWAGALAAAHSRRGQVALVEWARVEARREATIAFGALWRAIAEEEAWRTAAEDARRASEGLGQLVDAGLRPPADGLRARAQAAQLDALAQESAGQVTGRCAELQALIRVPIDGTCTLTQPAVGEPGTTTAEHPALVAAEQALKAARADRAGALLARAPRLEATGTAAEYIAGGQQGFGWSAGIQATLPVVAGGEGIGSNRTAVALRNAAALALEEQRRDLSAARLAAEARYTAVLASNDALALALESAEQALVRVESRYREGLEALEAWAAARRVRDEARVALARGRVAVLEAVADVEAVRGVW